MIPKLLPVVWKPYRSKVIGSLLAQPCSYDHARQDARSKLHAFEQRANGVDDDGGNGSLQHRINVLVDFPVAGALVISGFVVINHVYMFAALPM